MFLGHFLGNRQAAYAYGRHGGLHTRLSRHAQRGVRPARKLRLTITGSLAHEKSNGTLSQALEKERVQHADRLPIESDESFLSAS